MREGSEASNEWKEEMKGERKASNDWMWEGKEVKNGRRKER